MKPQRLNVVWYEFTTDKIKYTSSKCKHNENIQEYGSLLNSIAFIHDSKIKQSKKNSFCCKYFY